MTEPRRRLLAAIRDGDLGFGHNGLREYEIPAATGIPMTNVYRMLTTLIAAKLIKPSSGGTRERYYSITDAGRTAIGSSAEASI